MQLGLTPLKLGSLAKLLNLLYSGKATSDNVASTSTRNYYLIKNNIIIFK